MKIKNAFTLAEILIVLMVIGIIATLTVPSMMKNVVDAQYKTAYKKAYNTISNLRGALSLEGTLPVGSTATSINDGAKTDFFIAMLENLSVRDVTMFRTSNQPGQLPDRDGSRTVRYEVAGVSKTFGTGTEIDINNDSNGTRWLWITTEDNISYVLITASRYACRNKSFINSLNDINQMVQNSCIALLVDVNGIQKRPNMIESQSTINLGANLMQTLQGDMYYIFIANDGVTAGNKVNNVGARIIADVK